MAMDHYFRLVIGTLRSDNAVATITSKKNNRFGGQNNNFALQASHFFSLPFVQVDDVTLPNYTFYRGRKQSKTNFYFSF